jgi:hypothetical protein
MDDAIRPSQAAKRRSAHGEKPLFDVDDSSEASSILETDAGDSGSSDAQSEEEEEEEMPKRRMKGKTHKQTKSRPLPTEGVRRSTRKVSDTKTSYNMDVHPQDKYLVISSDDDIPTPSDKRKKLPRKRPNAEDSSESENQVVKRSKTHHRKRSRSTAHDTSGRIDLDSSGAPVSASVESGSDVGHRNCRPPSLSTVGAPTDSVQLLSLSHPHTCCRLLVLLAMAFDAGKAWMCGTIPRERDTSITIETTGPFYQVRHSKSSRRNLKIN